MGNFLDYNATLHRRIDITDGLTIFRFRPDWELPQAPWFIPGQYVTLGLNNTENPELGAVRRPMSVSSSCQERRHIEFYVRYVKQPVSRNPLTHLLWKLGEGDRAHLTARPKGHFTESHLVPEDGEHRLKLFIAAGTGLAPFVSMLRSKIQDDPQAALDDYAVVHGVSYPLDLAYRKELEQLASTSGLRYVPTVSRAHQAPEWSGRVGRVEDHLHPEPLAALERSIGLERGKITPENGIVLVCGLQGTIAASFDRLLRRGFVPDHKGLRRALNLSTRIASSLFFEQYDADPVIDLGDVKLLERLREQFQRDNLAQQASIKLPHMQRQTFGPDQLI